MLYGRALARQGAPLALVALAVAAATGAAHAGYTNFEASHVRPLALTPSGARLLALNTPDALLEVFAVAADGTLTLESCLPVGLEPVAVVARSDAEAWVVNHLSDTVSVVDLSLGTVTRTLAVGDEPNDVAFAGDRAFVAVGGSDEVWVFDVTDLSQPPQQVPLFGSHPRALAVSEDGASVYAVVLRSGNRTTVVNANVIWENRSHLDPARLTALGLNDLVCPTPPPPYPPLPPDPDGPGPVPPLMRNPALTDPPSGVPENSLIVGWNDASGRWEDEAGQDWTACLPYRLPDDDLFVIDVASLAVTEVAGLGTNLFEVSVQPGTGKLYVANTDARNLVRFEMPRPPVANPPVDYGLAGHIVDNQLTVVDPGAGFSVTKLDLNTHIDRFSDPASNLSERQASISQPGNMVWKSDGSAAYLTGIGTRKLFRVDGACAAGPCIFGADRADPDAVEVGEGPTGVALREGAVPMLYILNRFTNSIAIVDETTLTKLGEVALHDPSSQTIKDGRRFLYDAIIGSGHGDAACSTCHVSGDRDGLAWDLGNPTGDMTPYSTANDNVRFIVPTLGVPMECDWTVCAAHVGFDPQKGPMTTQTLRGMLEPLHWRGDRPTFNQFNKAFPGLMGTDDIGPVMGEPAGLSQTDMEAYRQFALGMRFPPNPFRSLTDQMPNSQVPIPGTPWTGNPTAGEFQFDNGLTDANGPCVGCHTHPFGASGGQLGGVTPAEPAPPEAAALFNGDADLSRHNDVKVPHLLNMYQKIGPTFGDGATTPDAKSGFGYGHDGTMPDLLSFFSLDVFTVNSGQARDIVSFMFHFPTDTRPCVGSNVTVPPGTPPTGTAADEQAIDDMVGIADRNDANRHGELVAPALAGGTMRAYYLSNGMWVPDKATDPPLTTAALRSAATGPVSFLCAPVDSGLRLGFDRDEDGVANLDDCAPRDPSSSGTRAPEVPVLKGVKRPGIAAELTWDPVASPGETYEVIGGEVLNLKAVGLGPATSCVMDALTSPTYTDPTPPPPPNDALYYFVRLRNGCGPGDPGPGRGALDAVPCP